jgi:hypothetical protein
MNVDPLEAVAEKLVNVSFGKSPAFSAQPNPQLNEPWRTVPEPVPAFLMSMGVPTAAPGMTVQSPA